MFVEIRVNLSNSNQQCIEVLLNFEIVHFFFDENFGYIIHWDMTLRHFFHKYKAYNYFIYTYVERKCVTPR